MKYFVLIIFLALQLPLCFAQKITYLDEDNTEISSSLFFEKKTNKNLMLTRWDSIGNDNNRYAKLNYNLYQKGTYDYNILKNELEKISGLKIPDSLTIIISYRYKDDLCNKKTMNDWSRADINSRKRWLKPALKKFKEEKIIYIALFEKGIKLNIKPSSKNKYFFIDKNNFFRKELFVSPTLCGSIGVVKPNGQILIRNGEFSPLYIFNYLKPEKWGEFFN